MTREEIIENKSDLVSKDMRFANMQNANMEGSLLTHIDARFLILSEDKEILFRMDCCVWAVTIWHKVVHIGCREFTFDDILNMDAEKAESIHEGAGKRWNRWGKTLKTAIQDIIDSGL